MYCNAQKKGIANNNDQLYWCCVVVPRSLLLDTCSVAARLLLLVAYCMWRLGLLLSCLCQLLVRATHKDIDVYINQNTTTCCIVALQNYTKLREVVRVARMVGANNWDAQLIEQYGKRITTSCIVAMLLLAVASCSFPVVCNIVAMLLLLVVGMRHS